MVAMITKDLVYIQREKHFHWRVPLPPNLLLAMVDIFDPPVRKLDISALSSADGETLASLRSLKLLAVLPCVLSPSLTTAAPYRGPVPCPMVRRCAWPLAFCAEMTGGELDLEDGI